MGVAQTGFSFASTPTKPAAAGGFGAPAVFGSAVTTAKPSENF
jgi:hypothetical protein